MASIEKRRLNIDKTPTKKQLEQLGIGPSPEPLRYDQVTGLTGIFSQA